MYLSELMHNLSFALQILVLFIWLYWFVIGLFGIGKVVEPKECKPKNKFLLMIAAHNEEKVIGDLIDNLKRLDYPNELYDICVIADNCNDNTEKIASEKGALVIPHYYGINEPKGKPYAIKYALEILGEYDTVEDAICIFDADNLVSLNYLKKMNNHLERGDKIIQAFLDSKNPRDNWISMSYATGFYHINRSWQLAREKLKLGNAIGGTGFCVKSSVLKGIGWNVNSLTEDLEFQMECLLHNTPANWCHTAKIYDEKPTEFKASVVQRLRWTRGHWDVCFRYAPKLFRKAVKDFDILAFDGMMYLLNPGKMVMSILIAIIAFLSTVINPTWFCSFCPWYIWIGTFLLEILCVAYALIKDTDKPLKNLKGLIFLPIFSYIYTPFFLYAFMTREKRTWIRTEHKRSLTLEKVV